MFSWTVAHTFVSFIIIIIQFFLIIYPVDIIFTDIAFPLHRVRIYNTYVIKTSESCSDSVNAKDK